MTPLPFEAGDRVMFGEPNGMIRGVVVRVSPTGRSVTVREDGTNRTRRFAKNRAHGRGWFLCVSDASWAARWELHHEA